MITFAVLLANLIVDLVIVAVRSAGPNERGSLMTTALTIATDPTALAAPARQLGRWRRLPLKAKAGVVLLGLFVLTAIIGPLRRALRP